MVTDQYFWSCDWGSSSFRLYFVESESCKIISSFSSSEGITKLAKLNNHIADCCHNYLSDIVQRLSKESGISGKFPCVLSGMTSSAHGWRPLDYSSVPFNLSGSTLKYEELDTDIEQIKKLYFLSGVKTDSDVMRGEETELMGLFEQEDYQVFSKDCTVIIPGTHSKHIIIKDGKLTNFNTFMTGEMFDLLSQHSVLRNNIEKGNENSSAFTDGVKKSQDNEILNSLFSVRTNDLFNKYTKVENYHFLSGLLIAYELKSCAGYSGHIVLYANEKMRNLYEQTFEILYPDLKVNIIKSDNVASIYGHRAFLKNLSDFNL